MDCFPAFATFLQNNLLALKLWDTYWPKPQWSYLPDIQYDVQGALENLIDDLLCLIFSELYGMK